MRVDQVRTAGVFTLDAQSFEVDNNIWLVGDDAEVIVIDAAHDADAIAAAVGGRRVALIACTHAHNDHVNAAADLADRLGAPIGLHPDDRVLWDQVHPARAADLALADGQELRAGGVTFTVLHTPGHTPGAVCFHIPDQAVLFSGDTLFQGGPGATGRSYSDFGTLIESIRSRLLPLPSETVVHAGHGDDTTIGVEAPHLQEWIERGS